MTFSRLSGCVAVFVCTVLADNTPPAHPVPFTIEASEDVSGRFPGAPRLQSFAWAQWEGKWIFIAGRTTGYHGEGGKDADFPRSGANDKIWVVDPSGSGLARTWSVPLADLPPSLSAVKDQWMSSNPEFVQDKDTLYLAGGYGQNAAGTWGTYPILSSVHLPSLVKAVTEKGDLSAAISYATSPLVQVAGGELLKLDNGLFYLIGGHVFTGSYRDFEAAEEKSTPRASQQYTGEIRKLRVAGDKNGHLTVALVQRYRNPEFARRDLNATLVIQPDGHSLGAAAYGGVFTKDQLGFSKAIYWSAASPPHVAEDYEQKMSGYSCAKLALFDPDSRTMLTTFFGGISRWTWNPDHAEFQAAPRAGAKSEIVYFDGLQWIDQITTLVRGPHQTYESVQPSNRLAGYLGTNAAFLPASGLPRLRADADVFDLQALRGKRVLAGYIYGGIRAFPREFPYRDDSPLYHSGNVPTRSSEIIVAVYITVPPANRSARIR
jgi:hypothetical protein